MTRPLLDALEKVRRLPLDQIPAALAQDVIAQVVPRDHKVVVEVARFNSSI